MSLSHPQVQAMGLGAFASSCGFFGLAFQKFCLDDKGQSWRTKDFDSLLCWTSGIRFDFKTVTHLVVGSHFSMQSCVNRIIKFREYVKKYAVITCTLFIHHAVEYHIILLYVQAHIPTKTVEFRGASVAIPVVVSARPWTSRWTRPKAAGVRSAWKLCADPTWT